MRHPRTTFRILTSGAAVAAVPLRQPLQFGQRLGVQAYRDHPPAALAAADLVAGLAVGHFDLTSPTSARTARTIMESNGSPRFGAVNQ